jgi:hypothetical protein
MEWVAMPHGQRETAHAGWRNGTGTGRGEADNGAQELVMRLQVDELHRVQVNLSQKIDQQGGKVWVATRRAALIGRRAPRPGRLHGVPAKALRPIVFLPVDLRSSIVVDQEVVPRSA